MHIEDNIIKMLSERTGVHLDKIKPSSKLNVDIVLDSLSYAEILMECEEQYNIEIPAEDAAEFKTVGDIVSYLEKKVTISNVN